MRSFRSGVVLVFFLTVLASTASLAQLTTRVSVATDGTQGNTYSSNPSINADGRYVAFLSTATNLVSQATNGVTEVFVRDRMSGQTSLASMASDGTPANGNCLSPAISGDGRYVAFSSLASNLVAGDTNNNYDVFVHDLVTGDTTRASVASDGTQGNGRSGSFGTTTRRWVSISADGQFVAFTSTASNLVPDDTNGFIDVFVHNQLSGATTRASVASDDTQGNNDSGYGGLSISADGDFVTFASTATNLVSGDTNNGRDVFVHDLSSGQTTRVSVASDGAQVSGGSQPVISGDGRYVAFVSSASNLVSDDTNGFTDVFLHDCVTGQTTRVSVASDGAQGNYISGLYGVDISADGRYVAFQSDASNLVPGDTNSERDIFVHDRVTGQTVMASVASDGTQENSASTLCSISGSGRYVAFDSAADNLVPGDTNYAQDIFVRDRMIRPSVVSTIPQSNATLVNPGQQVLLRFSEPMLKATVEANTAFQSVPSSGTPVDVPFTFQWYGTTAVRLIPDSSLDLATNYRVTVGSRAHTPDGRALGEDFVLSFTTSPSLILANGPADGATGVSRRHAVVISFRWRVRQGSAEDRFSLADNGGNPVSGTLTWLRPQQVLEFAPDKPLAGNETYTATMARGTRLADGRVISWPESFSFTTGDEPVVTVWAPKGDDVPVGRKIILIFDQAMHRVSVQSNFTVIPAVAGSFTWLDGNTRLEFTPSAPLAADTQYRVRLDAAARSAAGERLGRMFTWTFHTAAPTVTALVLTAAAAPTNGGAAQITVNLSAAANVGVTVSNIAGRVVATLPAQKLNAGLSTLLWNGRSTTGTMAPAGRYLVTVQAQNSDGSTASCLIPLQR